MLPRSAAGIAAGNDSRIAGADSLQINQSETLGTIIAVLDGVDD